MLPHVSRRLLTAVVVFFISAPFIQSAEIEVGATIRLVDRYQPDGSDKGIPGHPGVGDRKISARLPSGSTAVVKELGGDRIRTRSRSPRTVARTGSSPST